jgi:hypothetical protein
MGIDDAKFNILLNVHLDSATEFGEILRCVLIDSATEFEEILHCVLLDSATEFEEILHCVLDDRPGKVKKRLAKSLLQVCVITQAKRCKN